MSNKPKIKYSEIWGLQKEKYKWLEENDIESTDWQKLDPAEPFYFFVPQSNKGKKEYDRFWKITDVFPVNGVGITTARDSFVIDVDKERLINRIRLFKNSQYTDNDLHIFFKIRKKLGWDIRKAWNMLQDVPDSKIIDYIQPILYRPFDQRWIFYHDSLVWRTVKRIMQHMLRPNLALMSIRQIFKDNPFAHAFVTEKITDINSLHSPGVQVLFPLYLHDQAGSSLQKSLLEEDRFDTLQKVANISGKLISELKLAFQKEVSSEEVFYYIYAILYSDIYRQKYQEFLKVDFPRVPFTKDYDLFVRLGKLGKKLVDLHLLKSPELNNPIIKFYGDGDCRVKTRNYQPSLAGSGWPIAKDFQETDGAVKINESQSFDGIAKPVWNYYIGGYQVLDKWLKDRTDRVLSSEDIKHYCLMATSLTRTIEIQKEIDQLYPEVEKIFLSDTSNHK